MTATPIRCTPPQTSCKTFACHGRFSSAPNTSIPANAIRCSSLASSCIALPDGTYNLPHLQGPLCLNGSRDAAAAEILHQFRCSSGAAGQAGRGRYGVGVERFGTEFPGRICVRTLSRLGWRASTGAPQCNDRRARPLALGTARERGRGRLRLQAEEPRRRVEAELGVACQHFAYPFGNRNDVSGAAWRAVRDAGYSHAFTTMSGTLDAGQNPWLLPRYGLAMRERNLAGSVAAAATGESRGSPAGRRHCTDTHCVPVWDAILYQFGMACCPKCVPTPSTIPA